MRTIVNMLRVHTGYMTATAITIMALAAFASCSDEVSGGITPQPAETRTPIAFDAGSQSRTYGGFIYNTDDLHDAAFGVYACYTASDDYADNRWIPNFFFNQHVTWSADSLKWTYSPQRFWPNEAGSATGGTKHKVSFFAYAPYATVNASTITPTDSMFQTGDTIGITAVSGSNVAKAPAVAYRSAIDSAQQSADLMWGTASTTSNYLDAGGDSVTFTDGMPLLNLTRPSGNQAVRFRFRHALCRLGIMVTSHDVTTPIQPDSGTIILVKKVAVTGNVPRSGTLSLLNTTASTPTWRNLEYGNNTDSTTFVIDQRSITSSLYDLDYSTADSARWAYVCSQGGVCPTTRYLLKTINGGQETQGEGNRTYFAIIPSRQVTFTITVTYSVQTFDHGTNTRREITRTTTQEMSDMEAGQTYNINLVLTVPED